MSDEERDDLVERIAEAVVRRLERDQRKAPRGYWSLADVAEYMGRCESSIRNMVREGVFPPPDLGGGPGSKLAWRPETVMGFKRVN